MMKKMYGLLLLVLTLTLGVLLQENTSHAKVKSFIIKGNYIGTYSYKGYEPTLEGGGYTITINKISKEGKVRFQMSRVGANADYCYDTNVIEGKIKGKKMTFQWEDTWFNKGKGTIIFQRGKKLRVTVKETETAERNRSSLEVKNTTFKYINKKNKVNAW